MIDQWQMQDPNWLPLILQDFNLITLGKLKWGFSRPTSTSFVFTETDWMVQFCTQHALTTHGHNLCWNASNPAWLGQTLTSDNAAQLLTDHITTVMKRYAGSISSYDVVNEPIASWMGRTDGLYLGPWLTALGPAYIDIAFQAAEAADPQALRVLNIAHVEQGGSGSDLARSLTLNLITDLMKRGIPVQAIAFESHLDGTYSGLATTSRTAFINELRAFGLQVLISELDIDDTRVPVDIGVDDAAVAQCYGDYLSSILALAQPSRVTFFSPSDQKNWYDAVQSPTYTRQNQMPHRPGLYDINLSPKLAYSRVANALVSYGS